jgi:RTX calcium-binding nonapeptide repeat (4 copies)/Haemolysin-type calcium binding protein related domain
LFEAVADGRIQASGDYVDSAGNDRYTAPFYTESGDKIVISADSSSWFASMVRNGEIERIIQNNSDGSRIDTAFDWNNTQSWDQQTSVIDWSGELRSIETIHDDLTKIFQEYDTDDNRPWDHQTTTTDPQGHVTERVTELPGGTILRTTWNFDENGNPIGEPIHTAELPQVTINGNMIGSIFGSSLGQVIAGDDVFAQIATNTALSALLSNIGQSFDIYFRDTGGGLSLDQAAELAFGNFDTDVATAFRNQAVGAISSFLTGELAESLGFDSQSFGDQLLRATSGILINTVVNNVASQLPLLADIAGGGGDPVTAVMSFVGSYLAREIVQPETLGGAIGGSLGGQLGVYAGTLIGSVGSSILSSIGLAEAIGAAASIILSAVPIVGTIVGAFIGTLLGTVVGDLLNDVFAGLFEGPDHFASGSAVLLPGAQRFVETEVGANYGDLASMVSVLRTAATNVLNSYLGAIGGEVVADGRVLVNFYATSDGPYEEVSTSHLGLDRETLVNYRPLHYFNGGTTAGVKLDLGVIDALKALHIAGGNLYIKRAIANSTATTLQQLSGELKIAEDYGRYLANKDLIDALIALNPNSAFAAGWIVTLLRAEELGITELNRTDFEGGLVPFLKSFDVERFGGASLADVSVALEGNTLVISIAQEAGEPPRRIEIADYAQLTGLVHLTASPTGAPVSGGNRDELWIAADGVNSSFTDVSIRFDTFSNDVLVGGSGNDTINAGVGADLILGGAGNDTIDAGTGHDVIAGGTGTDTIQGGAGDDVFVFNRGDGADTIRDDGTVIAREEVAVALNGHSTELVIRPYNSPIPIGTPINGGADTLQFGRGIAVADLIVRFVGNDLVIAIRDPLHPDWGFDQLTDRILLTNWLDPLHRVETFRFEDGTVLTSLPPTSGCWSSIRRRRRSRSPSWPGTPTGCRARPPAGSWWEPTATTPSRGAPRSTSSTPTAATTTSPAAPATTCWRASAATTCSTAARAPTPCSAEPATTSTSSMMPATR